jgi:hypothetical protein
MNPNAPKVGRPSSFTQQLADEICERIALGETLRSICLDNHIPDRITVLRWLKKHNDFRNQYTQARLDQADTFAEEIIDIGRTAGDAQLGRLQMDALKWASSKIAPKKYGEKVEHEVNGSQKLNLTFTIGGRDDTVDGDFTLMDSKPVPALESPENDHAEP